MIIVGMLVLVLVLVLVVVVVILCSAMIAFDERRLITQGRAVHVVRVAANGNGAVYHSKDCRKCLGYRFVTLQQARRDGYQPCATCGGSPELIVLPRLDAGLDTRSEESNTHPMPPALSNAAYALTASK